jgi:polysaccharide export outer membrane protein
MQLRRRTPSYLAVLALVAAACVGAAVPADYLLQPGDVLTVAVWKEADLSGDVVIRPDGGITLPLAGEVAAAGHTVEQVRTTVDEHIRKYIPNAVVTVVVKQAAGNQIFVIGKVNRPGEYPLSRPVDVVQALSLAGGVTPFAAVGNIKIIRREEGRQTTLHFDYRDIEHGRNLQQNVLLRSGDTVVVP